MAEPECGSVIFNLRSQNATSNLEDHFIHEQLKNLVLEKKVLIFLKKAKKRNIVFKSKVNLH